MYCPSCGVVVAQGLGYCKNCGAKLNGSADQGVKAAEARPEFLISAMVTVFVVGLVAITMLMGMMKSVLRLEMGQILPFALLSFLIMLMIEGVCLWLLFHRKRRPEVVGDTVQLRGPSTKELDAAQTRALPEPMASVTEDTTQTLQPAYKGRMKDEG